ncbi:MAG: type II secretion system protein [Holophagaceae bacterium]|uniref:Type II secretion system protein n=1 Tax=Candidatus Geothrix skivensis TaxID=2954439 RepID=A0A9D7SDM3_9BACT|nr:type II secretion system protein [Candidatus Geothrix skivensis]
MSRQGGFTLLELVVTATVLLILASATVPLAKNGLRRQQELELRRSLREMRMAIDEYKKLAEQQKIKAPPAEANFYPATLEVLVEGVPATGSLSRKVRFLRRLPVDPFTGKAEWGMRNTNDDPTSTSWGGGHVYDVFSLSQGTGMNGIPYKEW